MHVVAAGVGNGHLVAVEVQAAHGAGVVKARVFEDRQGVHVGAQERDRAGPVAQHADNPGAADALGGGPTGRAQPLGHDPARAGLLECELRVAVKVAVDVGEVGNRARRVHVTSSAPAGRVEPLVNLARGRTSR